MADKVYVWNRSQHAEKSHLVLPKQKWNLTWEWLEGSVCDPWICQSKITLNKQLQEFSLTFFPQVGNTLNSNEQIWNILSIAQNTFQLKLKQQRLNDKMPSFNKIMIELIEFFASIFFPNQVDFSCYFDILMLFFCAWFNTCLFIYLIYSLLFHGKYASFQQSNIWNI